MPVSVIIITLIIMEIIIIIDTTEEPGAEYAGICEMRFFKSVKFIFCVFS